MTARSKIIVEGNEFYTNEYETPNSKSKGSRNFPRLDLRKHDCSLQTKTQLRNTPNEEWYIHDKLVGK